MSRLLVHQRPRQHSVEAEPEDQDDRADGQPDDPRRHIRIECVSGDEQYGDHQQAARIAVHTRRQTPRRASGTLEGRRRNSRIAVGATPCVLACGHQERPVVLEEFSLRSAEAACLVGVGDLSRPRVVVPLARRVDPVPSSRNRRTFPSDVSRPSHGRPLPPCGPVPPLPCHLPDCCVARGVRDPDEFSTTLRMRASDPADRAGRHYRRPTAPAAFSVIGYVAVVCQISFRQVRKSIDGECGGSRVAA